jgi:putative ABC transport system permease protein
VILLVGAGLLMKSLWRLQRVNSGLRPENVLTFNAVLPEIKYKTEKQAQFFVDLKKRLETTPGVVSTSWIYPLPLSDERFVISFEIEGRPMAPKDHPSADFFTTGVDYFKTMGIPLVKGRDFDDRDKHGSTPVVIVTEKFAREYFPNDEAVGKRIRPGISTFDDETTPWREIVGVVGDVRNRSLSTDPPVAYYVPQTQVPFTQLVGVIKTSNEPHSLISAVTKEVAAMDQDVP